MRSNSKKCTICTMDFSSMKDLERHVSDDHVTKFLDSFQTFKCDVCDEKFVNNLLKDLHTEKFHRLQCQRCGKQFTQNLMKHHECKIYVKNWHSSHGRESRYLPDLTRATFSSQNRFLIPEIDAVPSRKMDYALIDQITRFAKHKCESESKPKQLHFLCIGDNNLRWNKDSPETFMAKIELLVKKLSDIPNCFLVLASILPQPVSDVTSKSVFRETNSAMYDLSKNYPNVSFMNVTKSFVKDGKIDETLFERDGVHMKKKGAEKYANCIKRHAMGLKL